MTASQIIFYILAAFILGTAILSVTTTKIFRSAIWLLFSLIGIAGLYFWLEVEFHSCRTDRSLCRWHCGAHHLFNFSYTAIRQRNAKTVDDESIASMLAVLFGFALTYFLIYKNDFKAGDKPFEWSVNKIGNQMLATGENGYALPFEVVSILLLAAMVGCIVIAIKVPAVVSSAETKGQKQGNIENLKEKNIVEGL
jgi:NADH-quinone oxidoreductase subunit J